MVQMKLRMLLPMLMLLLCSTYVHAQTEHVYEDSAILYPQEEETSTEVIVQAPEETTDYSPVNTSPFVAPDTLLVNNNHFIPGDSAKALKNSRPFAYAKNLDSLLKDLKEKQNSQPAEKVETHDSPSSLAIFLNSSGLQYILWGIAIVFVLFILSKLFLTGGFFVKETTKNKVRVLEEEEEKHVKDRNFDLLIANAVKQQNYRLATRYLYLQLLQKLSGAGVIEFAADKTNSEYIRELTGKSYKAEVAALTVYYDYVWYGEFAIDATQFAKLEKRFTAFNI